MKAQDLFEQITDQLVADIQSGAPNWRMPWHTVADAATPTNLDGRPYRGLNAMWLPLVAGQRGWDTGVWGTYRAWQRHGAQVRRGSTGTHVVLWKSTTDTVLMDDDTEPTERTQLVARTYTVFAAEQVDGAEDLLSRRDVVERDTPERIAAAEVYFAAVGATVTEGGNLAGYDPKADAIRIPALAQFDTAAHSYATWAHETTHWTGHPSRLNRDLSGRFGDDAYGVEELIAELGAAFWCAQAGISAVTRPDHAAYLASWLRVLRTDARSLITVASKAQAAIDHLNAITGHTQRAA